MKKYLKPSLPSVPFLKEEAAVRVAEQKKKQVTSPENYRQLTLTSEHAVDKCLLTGNLLGEAVQNHNNSDCSSPKMWIVNLNNEFLKKSKPHSFFQCVCLWTECAISWVSNSTRGKTSKQPLIFFFFRHCDVFRRGGLMWFWMMRRAQHVFELTEGFQVVLPVNRQLA